MAIERIIPATLALLLVVGSLGFAQAKDESDRDRRDLAAISAMKVTLPQAIAAAEQQTGGRAVGADLSHDQGATRIAVEVAGPQGVKTVLVDGQTGQVTAMQDGQDGEDSD